MVVIKFGERSAYYFILYLFHAQLVTNTHTTGSHRTEINDRKSKVEDKYFADVSVPNKYNIFLYLLSYFLSPSRRFFFLFRLPLSLSSAPHSHSR